MTLNLQLLIKIEFEVKLVTYRNFYLRNNFFMKLNIKF